MVRAFLIGSLMAACLLSAALAGTRGSTVKEGVALTIIREPDKAIVCLSTRAPVHLSGEYGIHASWSGGAPQAKPIELYSKQDYFATPVQLELPLPRQARLVHVEVGACIENESCDTVEFNYDLRRLKPSADAASPSCEP